MKLLELSPENSHDLLGWGGSTGQKFSYESEDQLVVALDFGTTFSGITYAFKNDEKPEVISIMDWLGMESFKQPKVPTEISYDPKNKKLFTWGAQNHKGDIVQGVKLLLDPDQPRPIYLPKSTAKSDVQRLGKPAVDVAADFIGAMYKHAIERIESKVPKEYLEMCQKQFVLTVPAVWSDKAKDTTLKPFFSGGMAGSLGLNKRFEEAIKDLVGEDQHFTLRKTKGFQQATQQFDRDDVKAIFNPLINDIERLVEEQVNLVTIKRMSERHLKADQMKAIFLVGGFGSSEYLKCRLEAAHSEIQIIQPPDAWGAIVKTWYINRGEDLLREQTIRFPFYRRLREDFSDKELIFKDELIESKSKNAPFYPSSLTTKSNCELTADLRSVDRSKFKKMTGVDGNTYFDVHYDLAITMKPAVMKFSLEIKEKEMGTVNAKYH
ncbi:hypothetical protein G7Y89_g11126 [Cudoniella acicularis]|uniref:Hsp70 family protein n=1 Tax=Cudoniella acicularis TaxID=354080 RepID=A0A8H4VYK0_9HELO|nr:hypothetical protein G7Y89_g11126 [Cudoniella acicularis]